MTTLFAPGLSRMEDIRRVVAEVDRPVNVLMLPGGPALAELADAGVARISIGGSLWYVAMGAVATAARELRDGTIGYGELLKAGRDAVKGASFATS